MNISGSYVRKGEILFTIGRLFLEAFVRERNMKYTIQY